MLRYMHYPPIKTALTTCKGHRQLSFSHISIRFIHECWHKKTGITSVHYTFVLGKQYLAMGEFLKGQGSLEMHFRVDSHLYSLRCPGFISINLYEILATFYLLNCPFLSSPIVGWPLKSRQL